MGQPVHTGGIEDHSPKVGDLGPRVHPFAHDMKSCGGLLPTIGHNNPNGGEHGTQKNPDGGYQMYPRFYPVPTKQQYSQKTTFQRKSKNALCRQCTSKDISDITGVYGPVGAELKLHDNARYDPDTEGQGKYFGPKTS